MKRLSMAVLITMSLILCASASAQTLQFSLTDLGAFGGVSSDAKAVNTNGEIVGYSLTSSGQLNCFYWKASVNGGSTTWSSPKPGGTCIVYSINNAGVMAGTSTLTNGNSSAFSATRTYSCNSHRLCVWGVNSTYLSSLWGLSTYGASISATGTVVGSSNDTATAYHASSWTNGFYLGLAGDTSWGVLSEGYVDQLGSWQGSHFSQLSNGQTRAFAIYSWSGGELWEFEPLSNQFVNSQVAGGSALLPDNWNYAGWSYGDDDTPHAVVWPYGGACCDFDGGPNSVATGIVGVDRYSFVIGQGQGQAVPFLVQASGGFSCQRGNLQNYLDSTGSGWTLLEANAIQTVGGSASLYIVGSARNSLGQTHAVRLTSNGGTLCP